MYSCVSCLSHLLWRVNLCSTFRGIALPLIWVSLPHKCFGSTIYYINISSKGRHGYHPPQTLRTNPPYTPTWSDGLFSLLHFGLLLFPLLTGRLILRWPLITISYHLHQFCTRAAQGAFIASQPDSWGKAFLPILLHFYFYQNEHIFQNRFCTVSPWLIYLTWQTPLGTNALEPSPRGGGSASLRCNKLFGVGLRWLRSCVPRT